MDKVKLFNQKHLKKDIPEIRPGYTVRVHQRIKEGSKQRIQVFEGLVIAVKHGQGITATMTVRKIIDGIGVEKILPLHLPTIEKIEVIKRHKVRRAKLYYIRQKSAKKARLKEIGAKKPTKKPAPKKTSPKPSESPKPSKKEIKK